MHPLIESIEESLAGIVPPEPIEIRGAWTESMRRTYRDASQVGTGAGPFADVIDVVWNAVVECVQPLAGIAFLERIGSLDWVKSPPASPNLTVDVSLHAQADHSLERATFGAGLGRERLPGVAVSCGADLAHACAIGPASATTGRAHRVAEIDGVAFHVVLIQGSLLKTGRNRLWRLADRLAAELPAEVREILTRRRTGVVHDD